MAKKKTAKKASSSQDTITIIVPEQLYQLEQDAPGTLAEIAKLLVGDKTKFQVKHVCFKPQKDLSPAVHADLTSAIASSDC
jgi:hypothetical protein